MLHLNSVGRAPLEPGGQGSSSAGMVHSKPQTCRGTTHNAASAFRAETQRNKDVWGDYCNTKGNLSGPHCLHSFSLFLGEFDCFINCVYLKKIILPC